MGDVDLIEAFDFPEFFRIAQLDQRKPFRKVIIEGAKISELAAKSSAPVPSPRWASKKPINRESAVVKRFMVLISS